MATSTQSREARSPLAAALALAIGITLLLAGMLSLFAWPTAKAAPAGLPLVVAGPAPATTQLTTALGQARPGAFAITAVDSREQAVDAVTSGQAYGALVMGASGVEVLIATARSPVVAQLLGQAGAQLAATRGATATVTELVPLPSGDPRGGGLVAGLLPIVLGGLACAAATSTLLLRRSHRLLTTGTVAILGGLSLAWLLQVWLGSLTGPYLLNAAVLALGIAAVGVGVLGLENVFGTVGLGLGAVLCMLLGNALSGASSAAEMLPVGWGAVGQLLPPGATNTALRSVAFFGGAGSTRPLLVLAVWVVVGLALLALPTRTAVHAKATAD